MPNPHDLTISSLMSMSVGCLEQPAVTGMSFAVLAAHHNVGKTSLVHHLAVRKVALNVADARRVAALQRTAAPAGLRSMRRAVAARSR